MDQLQEWADSNREQADVVDYLVALGPDSARASLSSSQADTLRATADGWDAIIAARDAVDDPDRH